mgnify:CR=1 FL=1
MVTQNKEYTHLTCEPTFRDLTIVHGLPAIRMIVTWNPSFHIFVYPLEVKLIPLQDCCAYSVPGDILKSIRTDKRL